MPNPTLSTVVYANPKSLYHFIEKEAPATLCGRPPEHINGDWFNDASKFWPEVLADTEFCRTCYRRAKALLGPARAGATR